MIFAWLAVAILREGLVPCLPGSSHPRRRDLAVEVSVCMLDEVHNLIATRRRNPIASCASVTMQHLHLMYADASFLGLYSSLPHGALLIVGDEYEGASSVQSAIGSC